MERYRHRQFAGFILGGLLVAGAACAVAGALDPEARWVLLLAVVFITLALLFNSLTVRVTDKHLEWWFGPGFLRKRVLLAALGGVEVTETRLIEGWGVHLTSRGWLYNISGFGAVLVTREDGERFMLGSDEPEALAEAIRSALQATR
ncbi:MAG: hypothetical protein KC420_02385 [Myxococcales bacterium]|nr:hypothetical protein [Myxococcales bacterium]